MRLIEPDPDGKWRKEPRVFLYAGIMLVIGWGLYLFNRDPDWVSIALGAFTAQFVVTWAIEVTGNKVPDFMKPRPKAPPPPRTRRPGSRPE